MAIQPSHPAGGPLDLSCCLSMEQRPWGHYFVLSKGAGFQVKILVVKPGECTSLQTHAHRSECWIVLRGTPRVTQGDTTSILSIDQMVTIPRGMPHRIEVDHNSSESHILEVQTGDRLDEDDIVRLQDKYGRY